MSRGLVIVFLTRALLNTGHRRGSQVIVIHPGSRFIRIGRASDVSPVIVPASVGRKYRRSAPQTSRRNCIIRPGLANDSKINTAPLPQNGDEYDVSPASNDPVGLRNHSISTSSPCSISVRCQTRDYHRLLEGQDEILQTTRNAQRRRYCVYLQ